MRDRAGSVLGRDIRLDAGDPVLLRIQALRKSPERLRVKFVLRQRLGA